GLVTFTTVGVFSLAHSAMPDMAWLCCSPSPAQWPPTWPWNSTACAPGYRVLCPRWPRIPGQGRCRIASTRHRPRLYDRHRWRLEIDARGVCPGARRAGPPRRPVVDPRGLGRARAIRRRNRVPGSAPLVLREDGVALAGDHRAVRACRRDHASLVRAPAVRDLGGREGSRPREGQACTTAARLARHCLRDHRGLGSTARAILSAALSLRGAPDRLVVLDTGLAEAGAGLRKRLGRRRC